MIGTTITLNQAEQRLAKYLAAARTDNARSRGIKDRKVGSKEGGDMDLDGFGAELAFCRLMNCYPDMEIRENPSDDEQGDAILNGLAVDVKQTHYRRGKLLAVRWKEPKDLYALMVGTFPTYEFRGMATGDELINESNLIDLGHGEGYALTQDKLR